MYAKLLPLVLSTVLVSFVLVGGCPPSASDQGGSGSLRLLVTDKPYPIDLIASAEVTITRVEIRRAEADDAIADDEADDAAGDLDNDDQEDADGGDDDEAFITIFSGEKTFDLLDLQNGRTDLLADANVPAGTYTQMRLVVTGGRVTLTDARGFDLDVPSGEQSGIKLNFEFEIEDGQETTLLMDVDLSRAFSPIPGGRIDSPGDIREFKFHPAYGMRLIDLLEAGSISGTARLADGTPLPDVLVTAYAGDEETTSTRTAPDGTYRLIGLHTATYRLVFSASGYNETVVEGVVVQAGEEVTGVDAVLTPLAP